jgi:hypothetical protein
VLGADASPSSSKESPNSSWKALKHLSFAAWAAAAAALIDLAIVHLEIIDAWAASFAFTVGPVALPGVKPRGVRIACVIAWAVDVAVWWWPIAWPIALPIFNPGGVRVTTIVTATFVPGGELQLGYGGGQAAAAWLRLGHGQGRRRLLVTGGLAFLRRLEMKPKGWTAAVFRVINKGATKTVVKLSQRMRWVQHTEWEGRKGKQSPDGNVSKFPVCQVEDWYDTVPPPVGNILFL